MILTESPLEAVEVTLTMDLIEAPAKVLTCAGDAHSEPPHAKTLIGVYFPVARNAPRFATT